MNNEHHFTGYEYKSLSVSREMENIYLDTYPSFGWKLEGSASFLSHGGLSPVVLKFKRDRKIRNKDDLIRLERQFENSVYEIERLEKSKTTAAHIAALTVGIIGTAFMASSVFAYLNGKTALMVVLAVPAIFTWIIPYFCYTNIKAKWTQAAVPLIGKQYDMVYQVCEEAHVLLAV